MDPVTIQPGVAKFELHVPLSILNYKPNVRDLCAPLAIKILFPDYGPQTIASLNRRLIVQHRLYFNIFHYGIHGEKIYSINFKNCIK